METSRSGCLLALQSKWPKGSDQIAILSLVCGSRSAPEGAGFDCVGAKSKWEEEIRLACRLFKIGLVFWVSVMGFLVIMVGLFGNTQHDISRENFRV